ncbi:acyl-CoA carboxylase subunit epsilon [Luteococcus sp. Sow4_B9]|uniref:acyl-CoA carboxylase subunit epsilon n=1 Tax=Luteococcus sp. Sow4_B9 TaxID=3438792 RepID=UPI003F9CE214
MSENETETTPQAPLTIEVTGGNPDDAETAAVITALMAAMAPSGPVEESDDRPLAGGWKSYTRVMRRMPTHGREAWRYSARP